MFNFYPFNDEDVVKVKGNKAIIRMIKPPITFLFSDVLLNQMDLANKPTHLSGYVALPKVKVPREWWGNYKADGLQSLNVHGGITYCRVISDYVVFGFDCTHKGDDKRPELDNPDYVMELVEDMERQLLAYAEVVEDWRKADVKERTKIIEQIKSLAKHSEGQKEEEK